MANQSDKSLGQGRSGSVGDGLGRQLITMYHAFTASPERAKLFMLFGAVSIVVAATAYGQIRLNAWNKPFYDAIARRDLEAFLGQLLVFVAIAAGLLILNVSQTWLNQMMKLKLRQGLARDLIEQWLEPKRAFLVAKAGEIGVNPDQRLHEDTRHLTELSTDLGIGLLQASLLLASFIGVLWVLSENVTLSVSGSTFSIPGYMVWCALLYAMTGSWLSWRVGRPLIPLNAERYQRESDFRFALVRVNQHADSIALYSGEANEKQHLRDSLDTVFAVMRQMVTRATLLTWVSGGYGWFAIVAPTLVAAPGYFSGRLSLGELMMAAGAFTQVQQALRWFVDNFNTIADWTATLRRVAAFRCALVDVNQLGAQFSHVERSQVNDNKITFDNLSVMSSASTFTLGEPHVEIDRGERILIIGDSGSGLTIFFHAIAGLWPWGSGSIGLPRSEVVMFIPKHAYMPPGTLRETLTYPSPVGTFPDEDCAAACRRVGLVHLSSQLDRRSNWDIELGDDELQRLAFARLLLQQPRWVCIDQALDALDDVDRRTVMAILDKELAQASVISLDRRDLGEGFSKRVLRLATTAVAPAAAGAEAEPKSDLSTARAIAP